MLGLTNFDKDAARAIQAFSTADPNQPLSWTPEEALAYSALCIKFEIAYPDQVHDGLAPYDAQIASNLQVTDPATRNLFVRFANLMNRAPGSRDFTKGEIAVCKNAQTSLKGYLTLNNSHPPDDMDIEITATSHSSSAPHADPKAGSTEALCYGETSLVDAAGEIKDLSQMSDAQPDSPVYQQIHDRLGGGSSADSGGLDTGGEDGEHTGESGETGGER